jgi:hypothetical protein
MVVHSAVNREVVGSSPTSAATGVYDASKRHKIL